MLPITGENFETLLAWLTLQKCYAYIIVFFYFYFLCVVYLTIFAIYNIYFSILTVNTLLLLLSNKYFDFHRSTAVKNARPCPCKCPQTLISRIFKSKMSIQNFSHFFAKNIIHQTLFWGWF